MTSDDDACLARREFLGLAAAGLALPEVKGWPAPPGPCAAPPDAACIVICNTGGMSHLDLWDLKPGAPREIRGAFAPIATNVPGIFVSELLPETARVADRLAIVRSMTHDEGDHDRAWRLLSAGRPLFATSALAAGHGPCAFDERRSAGDWETSRRSYGTSSLARRCWLAAQLIEEGHQYVTIENGHWDTHGENTRCLRDVLAPVFDQAFAALVGDLSQRGLLDSMRVIVATEFGRSPSINPRDGRDHWPGAFSIVMAGGPVAGGAVIGGTDRRGAEVIDRPVAARGLLPRPWTPPSMPGVHDAFCE